MTAPKTAALLAVCSLFIGGCKDKESAGPDRPPLGAPPPPTSTSSAGAKSNGATPCSGGGGEVKDPVSGGFFPKTAGGFCVDPNGDAMVYGDKEKHSMDEVCTKEF